MPPETIALAPSRSRHRPRFRRAAQEERPAFRLTDRDRELLRVIFEYRYITADMLQDLAPPVVLSQRQQEALDKLIAAKKATIADPATSERHPRTKREILRRLQMLYHHGYVQRHKLSDGESIAYALGNKGADELVLYYGIDRQKIDWTTKNREAGERYIRHGLMVSRFRHAIELTLRQLPGAALDFWEPSGVFKAPVQYEDAVRTREGLRTQLVDGVVIPDGLFKVTGGGKPIHYFLEADRSTMSNARYLAKLKSYFAFYSTYVHDHDGKQPSGITQMRVLTITLSEERKKNLRKIAQEVSPQAKELFWFACERSYRGVPEHVISPIWQTLKDDTLKNL
jgi:Replication-relaxation